MRAMRPLGVDGRVVGYVDDDVFVLGPYDDDQRLGGLDLCRKREAVSRIKEQYELGRSVVCEGYAIGKTWEHIIHLNMHVIRLTTSFAECSERLPRKSVHRLLEEFVSVDEAEDALRAFGINVIRASNEDAIKHAKQLLCQ